MKNEIEQKIFEKMKAKDFGESMSNETKLNVLRWTMQQLRKHDVSVSLPSDPMVLAEYLHDNYEQIAKRTNWQTQKNCKVEFKDLPIENKNTMILLAGKLILDFVGNER